MNDHHNYNRRNEYEDEPPKLNENEIAEYLEDINEEDEGDNYRKSSNQPLINPPKSGRFNNHVPEVDEDVNNYFNKVREVGQKEKKEEIKYKNEPDSSSEDSFDAEDGDEDELLDMKIKALSGLPSIKEQKKEYDYNSSKSKGKYSNSPVKNVMKTVDIPKIQELNKDPQLNNIRKGIADIKLQDRRTQGDITGIDEDDNDTDLLQFLDTGYNSEKPEKEEKPQKSEESLLLEAKLGEKRNRQEMEADTLIIPEPERKDKRYNYNFDDEGLAEISTMVIMNKNQNLDSFERAHIDLQAPPMEIENFNDVYLNRNNYSKYYVLSMLEMMKYDIEEDFNNKK